MRERESAAAVIPIFTAILVLLIAATVGASLNALNGFRGQCFQLLQPMQHFQSYWHQRDDRSMRVAFIHLGGPPYHLHRLQQCPLMRPCAAEGERLSEGFLSFLIGRIGMGTMPEPDVAICTSELHQRLRVSLNTSN